MNTMRGENLLFRGGNYALINQLSKKKLGGFFIASIVLICFGIWMQVTAPVVYHISKFLVYMK